MLARARARAPPLAAGRPVPARARDRVRARVWVWVWVPYLAWFFLNRVSRVWITPLPEPNPLRSATQSAPAHPPTGVCLRTDPNRPPTAVGKPSVRLDRTVATVLSEPLQLLEKWRTRMPFRSAINSAPDFHSQHTKSKYLSLFI